MTYEELKKAYEESQKRCSELEKENADLKQSNENKDLRNEHLTELVLKRNKMLFGQKSEKGKYICDGQMTLDGGVFNEAEAESNPAAPEPTVETVTKKSKKPVSTAAEKRSEQTLKRRRSSLNCLKISKPAMYAAVR